MIQQSKDPDVGVQGTAGRWKETRAEGMEGVSNRRQGQSKWDAVG